VPHLTLEYSANVECPGDLRQLFARLHGVLAEVGGIRPGNCKSRGRVAQDYLVSSGGERDAFVHLDIRFLEGRPPQIRQQIGELALATLTDWFQASLEKLELQVTVEIRDIARSRYFKHPEGTLTPQ
jgi:5-carboxymethyl-2-hydroxymuconate isomerase